MTPQQAEESGMTMTEYRQWLKDEDIKELAAMEPPPDYLRNAPPPQLVDPERLEAVAAAVSNPGYEAYHRCFDQENAQAIAMSGFLVEPQAIRSEPVTDLSDPLKHIREMIVADFPEAATATDEELGILYDKWEAQHDAQ